MTPDMKNIFDFATKELSQDAFLRWLFENYNCGDSQVRAACRRLFDSFTNNKLDFEKIENLKTVAQWKSIDVAIWFDIGDKNYLIVIEDKTFTSDQNNQLQRYRDAISEHNKWWRANAGEHTWHASVNVYSVDPRPSMEQIGRWQKALTDMRENIASRRTPGAPGEKDELTHTGEDIKLNHRKDPESFQQIGHISFPVEGDTGAALRAVLDRALDLFCDLYC